MFDTSFFFWRFRPKIVDEGGLESFDVIGTGDRRTAHERD
jgi:hypothetical protein